MIEMFPHARVPQFVDFAAIRTIQDVRGIAFWVNE